MELAVLIPARDEGPSVGAVILAAREALPHATLIVVDGHSGDDTAEAARAAGAEVVMQQGRGYASALRTGYRLLASRRCARVVQLDADGQHPAGDARRLLDALGSASMVVATRDRTPSGGALGRRVGNVLLSGAVRLATGTRFTDVTSGFWALDGRALDLFARHFPADVADANVRVLARRLGLTVVEVPVTMAARAGGASMHDGWRGALHFVHSLRAVARERVRALPGRP